GSAIADVEPNGRAARRIDQIVITRGQTQPDGRRRRVVVPAVEQHARRAEGGEVRPRAGVDLPLLDEDLALAGGPVRVVRGQGTEEQVEGAGPDQRVAA